MEKLNEKKKAEEMDTNVLWPVSFSFTSYTFFTSSTSNGLNLAVKWRRNGAW